MRCGEILPGLALLQSEQQGPPHYRLPRYRFLGAVLIRVRLAVLCSLFGRLAADPWAGPLSLRLLLKCDMRESFGISFASGGFTVLTSHHRASAGR